MAVPAAEVDNAVRHRRRRAYGPAAAAAPLLLSGLSVQSMEEPLVRADEDKTVAVGRRRTELSSRVERPRERAVRRVQGVRFPVRAIEEDSSVSCGGGAPYRSGGVLLGGAVTPLHRSGCKIDGEERAVGPADIRAFSKHSGRAVYRCFRVEDPERASCISIQSVQFASIVADENLVPRDGGGAGNGGHRVVAPVKNALPPSRFSRRKNGKEKKERKERQHRKNSVFYFVHEQHLFSWGRVLLADIIPYFGVVASLKYRR